jgi:arylsulfatase A-like enzyme
VSARPPAASAAAAPPPRFPKEERAARPASKRANKESATAVDGVSIAPMLRGEARLSRTDLFWHYPHYWNGGKVNPYSVVRSGDWKLIRFYEAGREELYDLKADPSEQHDLSESNPENRAGLAKRLDAWLAGVGAQMPVPR